MNQVPAWTAPGSAYVVEQLSCGQAISIIALERGYFRIRFGNRIGYVYAKYVRLPESWGIRTQRLQPIPPPTEPQSNSNREKQGRHRFGLAFEVSHIKYEEPGIMNNKGVMWGVSGDYTFHPENFMFRLDGRFSFGDVDYWSKDTGTDSDIRDYNLEARFAFGYEVKTASPKVSFTPFTGLGYRYLADLSGGTKTSTDYSGYDRESNYLYSPIGIETILRLKGSWFFGLAGEYDLFWHGWQYSQLGDIDPGLNTLKNDQKDGWGARGSVRISKRVGRMDLCIEPYFRYWDIGDSDIDILTYFDPNDLIAIGPMHEPPNTTREWGSRLGIRF